MGITFKVLTATLVATLVYLLVPIAARSGISGDGARVLEAFLQVVGGIYSVLTAFVIFVVWEQFNALQKLTVREGCLVSEVPRLAARLGGEDPESRRRIAWATRAYLDAAVAEWEQLAALRESRAAVKALDTLDARVAEGTALGGPSPAVHGQLLDAIAAVRECRVSRVSAAKHRMPATLSHLLSLLSLLLLVALLVMPAGESPWVALTAFASLAAVLTMVRAVVWDMDHPFVGVWRVGVEPFTEAREGIG